MKIAVTYLLITLLCVSLVGCEKKADTSDPIIPFKSTESNIKKEDTNDNEQIKEQSPAKDDTTDKAPLKEQSPAKDDTTDKNTEISQTTSKKENVVTGNVEPSPDPDASKDADKENQQSEKEPEQTENESYYAEEEIHYAPPSKTFTAAKFYSSDTFLCTVIEEKLITEPLVFPSIYGLDSGVYIYKVKIEKIYRGTFTTEDTYINVISSAKEPETEWEKQYAWVTPLEVGEKYVISGMIQPYKKAPVMVNTAGLSAHVKNDGTLSAQSYVSGVVLSKYKTLEEFENASDAKEFFDSKYELISTIADDYAATRLDGVSPEDAYSINGSNRPVDVKSDEEVIEYIKKAIILDK